MKAIVLCAGKSTRIDPISRGLPKPLLKIGKKSVIQRILTWLAKEGISDIWINLHHRPEAIMNHVKTGEQCGVHVQYVFEPKLLGTAGAVKNIAETWTEPSTEPFLVVYGDNLYAFDLKKLINDHQHCVTVTLFDRDRQKHTIAGGQVMLRDGVIEEFIEGTTERVSPYVNAGVYVLEPTVLQYMPKQECFDFGHDLFPLMLRNNVSIGGHVMDGYCLGIDTPESYEMALGILGL